MQEKASQSGVQWNRRGEKNHDEKIGLNAGESYSLHSRQGLLPRSWGMYIAIHHRSALWVVSRLHFIWNCGGKRALGEAWYKRSDSSQPYTAHLCQQMALTTGTSSKGCNVGQEEKTIPTRESNLHIYKIQIKKLMTVVVIAIDLTCWHSILIVDKTNWKNLWSQKVAK